MQKEIDIQGIDKVALLKALWEKSIPALFFQSFSVPPPEWDDDAVPANTADFKFDYFLGRVIKADLSGDSVSPRLYNRDVGDEAFEEVMEELRKH